MSFHEVLVVGAVSRTRKLSDALRCAALNVSVLSPGHVGLGWSRSEQLAVLAWQPGQYPEIETAAYLGGVGVLHVAWGSDLAEVGPFVSRGLGPCPSCLSRLAPRDSVRGQDPAVGAWAASLAALEAMTALDSRRTSLVGTSWRWSRSHPAPAHKSWPARPGCTSHGCTQA